MLFPENLIQALLIFSRRCQRAFLGFYYPDHSILRTPQYHPELQPIETCWGIVKNHMADQCDFTTELVASFLACQCCSPWPSWRPRAVAGCGAVTKIGGTPRQPGGWKAHEPCMFCSCTRRCAGRISLHFLPMFQEVGPISKTRNQLNIWTIRHYGAADRTCGNSGKSIQT